MSAPACISPFDVVDRQFDAYNSQDLEAFCSYYADDAVTPNGSRIFRRIGLTCSIACRLVQGSSTTNASCALQGAIPSRWPPSTPFRTPRSSASTL